MFLVGFRAYDKCVCYVTCIIHVMKSNLRHIWTAVLYNRMRRIVVFNATFNNSSVILCRSV